MFWSWTFLLVTLVGAWFTFNAWLPSRKRGVFAAPRFFAGWLTGELAQGPVSAHVFLTERIA